MKKVIFAICATALVTVSAIAQDVSEQVKVSVDITKNGKAVQNYQVQAAVGRKQPWANMTEKSYAADCKPNVGGGFDIVSGKITTGTIVAVTPVSKNSDGVLIAATIHHDELASMLTYTNLFGCAVDEPATRGFTVSSHVFVKHGEALVLPAEVGEDKYVVQIRAL